MERDPFGLLSSDWVTEGETLLFIEDFQDGEEDFAEVWGDWQVVKDADNPGNMVVQINQQNNLEEAYADLGPDEFYDSFIIEYKFRWIEIVPFTGDEWQSLGFDFWYRYDIDHYPVTGGFLQILDYSKDPWTFPVQIKRSFKIGTWYTMRAEVNGSEVSLYLNGKLVSRYKNLQEVDPNSEQGYYLYALPHLIGQFDDIVLILP